MSSTQTKGYLGVLLQSLRRKNQVLDELTEQTILQERILAEEEPDAKQFDATILAKGELLKQLAEADDGFTAVYERIGSSLKQEKADYKEEIIELQDLVREISAKNIRLQGMEYTNRDALERYLGRQRNKIKQSRVSTKTAARYYQSMSGRAEDSYFMDQKK